MEKSSAGTLDTLSIYQRLKGADLSENAACEIATVMKDVVEGGLISREDLGKVKSDLEIKIEQIKSDLDIKIEKLQSDLEFKIEQIKSDLEIKVEQIKSDLEFKIEKLQSDLEFKIEQNRSSSELKNEKTKTELVLWVTGLLVAQATVIVSLIKLL